MSRCGQTRRLSGRGVLGLGDDLLAVLAGGVADLSGLLAGSGELSGVLLECRLGLALRLVGLRDVALDGFAAGVEMATRGDGLPDAVFAVNDMVGLGVVRGLTSFGIDVPRDVAVIGAGPPSQRRTIGTAPSAASEVGAVSRQVTGRSKPFRCNVSARKPGRPRSSRSRLVSSTS